MGSLGIVTGPQLLPHPLEVLSSQLDILSMSQKYRVLLATLKG